MGRSVFDVRGCAAAALMACGLTVTASAQHASVPSSPADSTQTQRPELPVSVERVRDGLAREPAIRLDGMPVFSLTVNERRPRYWDLQGPFTFPMEPRTTTTRWHDEFRAMVTPSEATMYGSMLSQSETATIAATSLLFAGAASLVKAGFSEWKRGRREGRARDAAAEVDAALAAWQAAHLK